LGLSQEIIKNASDISIQDLTQMGMTMYQVADNLFKLLQNLLEWAQLQSDTISTEPKDILLTKMIAKNIEMIKNRSEQKDISIINKVTDPIHAYADEKMVNSILLNLLSNAVKFTNRSGTITVSAGETEDKIIELSVRDTGAGMPKNMMEN
jgi:two-component system, sensor histidine kinase and response regulator